MEILKQYSEGGKKRRQKRDSVRIEEEGSEEANGTEGDGGDREAEEDRVRSSDFA